VKAGEVRKGVTKLTSLKPRGADQLYAVECPFCHVQVGWTKVSRKPDNTQLGKRLEGLIPKQLNASPALFADIVGCTKGQKEYLAAVGHAH
jgi:hypothetical protein